MNFYLQLIQPMYFAKAARKIDYRGDAVVREVVFALLAGGTLLIGVLPQTALAFALASSTIWRFSAFALSER